LESREAPMKSALTFWFVIPAGNPRFAGGRTTLEGLDQTFPKAFLCQKWFHPSKHCRPQTIAVPKTLSSPKHCRPQNTVVPKRLPLPKHCHPERSEGSAF
jgi:hypothetical protein